MRAAGSSLFSFMDDQCNTETGSAAEVDETLRPIAGDFAFWPSGRGIIGTGLLSSGAGELDLCAVGGLGLAMRS